MLHTVLLHCRNLLAFTLVFTLVAPNLTYGFFGPDETPSAPSTGADFSESGYQSSYGGPTTGPGSTDSGTFGGSTYSEGGYQSSYGGPTTGPGSTDSDTFGGSVQSGYYNPDSSNDSSDSDPYDQGYTGQPGGNHVPSESSGDSNGNSSYFGDIPSHVKTQNEQYETAKAEAETRAAEATSYGVDVDTSETISRTLNGDISDGEVVDTDGNVVNLGNAKKSHQQEVARAENVLRYGLDTSNDRSLLDAYEPIGYAYTWTFPSPIDPGYTSLLTQAANAGVDVDLDKTIAAHEQGTIGEREIIDAAGNTINADEAAARYIAAYNQAEWAAANREELDTARVITPTEQTALNTVTAALANNPDTYDWWDFLAEPPNPNTDETYVTLKARAAGIIEPGQRLVRNGSDYIIEGTGGLITIPSEAGLSVPVTPGLGIITGDNPLAGDQLTSAAQQLARIWIGETSPSAKLLADQFLKGEALSEDSLALLAAQALAIGNEAFIKNQSFLQNTQNQSRITSLEDGTAAILSGDYTSTQIAALEELAEQILSGQRNDIASAIQNLAYATNWITPKRNAEHAELGRWTIQTDRGFGVLEGTGSIYDRTVFGQSNLAVGTNAYGDYQFAAAGEVPLPALRGSAGVPVISEPSVVTWNDVVDWAKADIGPNATNEDLDRAISETHTTTLIDASGRPIASVAFPTQNSLMNPYDFSNQSINESLGIEILEPGDPRALFSPGEIASVRDSVEQYKYSLEFSDTYKDYLYGQNLPEAATNNTILLGGPQTPAAPTFRPRDLTQHEQAALAAAKAAGLDITKIDNQVAVLALVGEALLKGEDPLEAVRGVFDQLAGGGVDISVLENVIESIANGIIPTEFFESMVLDGMITATGKDLTGLGDLFEEIEEGLITQLDPAAQIRVSEPTARYAADGSILDIGGNQLRTFEGVPKDSTGWDIRAVPTGNYGDRLPDTEITGIITHHTATKDIDSVIAAFMAVETGSPRAYHYAIDADGTIYNFLDPETDRGYGAMSMKLSDLEAALGTEEAARVVAAVGMIRPDDPSYIDFNNRNVHVALVGDGTSPPTAAQTAAMEALTGHLAQQFPSIDPNNVYGHGEVNPGHKHEHEGEFGKEVIGEFLADHDHDPVAPINTFGYSDTGVVAITTSLSFDERFETIKTAMDASSERLDKMESELTGLREAAEASEGGLDGNSPEAQRYDFARSQYNSALSDMSDLLDAVDAASAGEIVDVNRVDYLDVVAKEGEIYERSILLDQAAKGLIDSYEPSCDCVVTTLSGAKARPLDVSDEYKSFLNQSAAKVETSRGSIDLIEIFSGSHEDPRLDPTKIPDASIRAAYEAGRMTADEVLDRYGETTMASGNHAHGYGADPYFIYEDGTIVDDREGNIAIIEALVATAGPNVGIGYSTETGRITHVNLRTEEGGSVGVWGYPGGRREVAPDWVQGAYDSAAARYSGVTYDPNKETNLTYISTTDQAQLAYYNAVRAAASLPDDHPNKQTAYTLVEGGATEIRDRIIDASEVPPAIVGYDFADDRLKELADIERDIKGLKDGDAHDHDDGASGAGGGGTGGTGTGGIGKVVTDAFTSIGKAIGGLIPGGGGGAIPSETDSSDYDSTSNNISYGRNESYFRDNSTTSRSFSNNTLNNLFNTLLGQKNDSTEGNTSPTATEPIEDESATPEERYIPVTVTVNELTGEVTFSRNDLIDSINEYNRQNGSLPPVTPLDIVDPLNIDITSIESQIGNSINSRIVKLPPTIGGVGSVAATDESSYYQSQIEPLLAFSLLASETVSPPLVLNDAGEVIYSNGVYAPPIENGIPLYSDEEIPAYVYLVQYVNEDGVVELDANDDILPGNFFTNIISSIFDNNDPFTINDVVEVTYELIDPRENVPRDEYYQYVLRLTDGSLRKTTVPEFSSVSFMRERFGELGYEGDVLALIGLGTEITTPRENDKNIVNRALDLAGNALKQFTSLFGGKKSDKVTYLPSESDNTKWSIENVQKVFVYPEAQVSCPKVEGLYDGYVYKAILIDHNNPNEAITITEARCGLGDPLTLINEIAINLENTYGITPLPIEKLTEKTAFNSAPIDYEIGITQAPILTVAADQETRIVTENPDRDDEFIPNTTNTVSFAVKATDRLGNVLVDWTTNDLSISGDTQLHFRWDGSDYNQCLPFLNDGGRYSLSRSFDQSMKTGNTEAESYDIVEASTDYWIECGGQNNGEFGVDRRVIEVSVN